MFRDLESSQIRQGTDHFMLVRTIGYYEGEGYYAWIFLHRATNSIILHSDRLISTDT